MRLYWNVVEKFGVGIGCKNWECYFSVLGDR